MTTTQVELTRLTIVVTHAMLKGMYIVNHATVLSDFYPVRKRTLLTGNNLLCFQQNASTLHFVHVIHLEQRNYR